VAQDVPRRQRIGIRVLTTVACQVGDPLSEAVCWNGFWLLVTSGGYRKAVR
jgi:hypothetical protein